MGREFAGVLGYLAFTIVIARSLLVGGGFDGTVKLALMMLFAFAGVGYVAGAIAQRTVHESVLQSMRRQLDGERDESAAKAAEKG